MLFLSLLTLHDNCNFKGDKMIMIKCIVAERLDINYRVSKEKATIQIQISALNQTTYCIQFQRMQFHLVRSFSSCPCMCIKLSVFLRIRRSKAIMNFKAL